MFPNRTEIEAINIQAQLAFEADQQEEWREIDALSFSCRMQALGLIEDSEQFDRDYCAWIDDVASQISLEDFGVQ